jgi:hypothetical protein
MGYWKNLITDQEMHDDLINNYGDSARKELMEGLDDEDDKAV